MQISPVFVGVVYGLMLPPLVEKGDWASAALLTVALCHQLWLYHVDWQKSRRQTP